MPATTPRMPGSRPTSPPASTAVRPSAPRPTPILQRPPSTRSRARRRSSGRSPITSHRATTRPTPPSATATRWGWPSIDGQVYPVWAGNFNEAIESSTTLFTGPLLQILLPADGHRRPGRGSSAAPWGRSQLLRQSAQSARQPDQLHRHLRPADRSELSRIRPDVHRGRRPGLLSRHHQRRSLDPASGAECDAGSLEWSRPRQQVRLHRVHGHLRPDHAARRLAQRHHQLSPARTAT